MSTHDDLWDKRRRLSQLRNDARVLAAEIQAEEQSRLRARLRQLPPQQRLVLSAMMALSARGWSGDLENVCYGYARIYAHAKLTRRNTKRALGALRQLGFVEFHRGLFNDDGEVAGSGYCITNAGKSWWQTVEDPDKTYILVAA